jgi:hypothetical protein
MNKKPLIAGYQYDGDDIIVTYASIPSGFVKEEHMGKRLQIMGWSELKDHPLPKDFRKYVMRTAYAAGVEECFFLKGELFFGPVLIGAAPMPFWVNIALHKKVLSEKSLLDAVNSESPAIAEPADLAIRDILQKRLDNLFQNVWQDAKSEALGIPNSGDDLAVRPEQLGENVDSGQDQSKGTA